MMENLFTVDDERDAEAEEWNRALASNDPDRILAVSSDLLRRVATRIMDDEPVYVVGGWTPS